jgi:hypothetical protein
LFRCQACGCVVPSGVRSHRVTVMTRRKVYEARGSGHSSGQFRGRRGGGGSSRNSAYDKGGEGREIVQELIVCPACAEKWREEHGEPQAESGKTESGKAES